MPSVNVSIAGDVAVLEIDNPPVNALSHGVPEGLMKAIADAETSNAIRAVVILGAGRTFVAGADIKDLERAAWDPGTEPPDIHPLLTRIEDAAKPVVMAIHGTALGGGLELAMAGHYRVAVRDSRVGLPEASLGIIPGAEGTQRLPRLVGVERAIDLIVTGKLISAAEAYEAGLIDRLLDGDLREDAVAFAREIAGQPYRKTRERLEKLGSAEANAPLFEAGRQLAAKIRRHQTAPLAALEALQAATTLPFDQGRRRERELAIDSVRTPQCRAFVHGFIAERAVAKVPGVTDDPAAANLPAVGEVAIVGAGTMGSGIAMACANAGVRVTLTDASQERLDAGFATLRRNYDSSVKRGRLTPAQVEERIARVSGKLGYDACATADIVIEAVFEQMALKQQVFAALDTVAKPGAMLATNTSMLDIDAIASATRRPESVVGLHFFSPAHVMRLVEIVRGAKTDVVTLAAAMALAKKLGKVGVLVRNSVGFVGNRMMLPYMYEAQFLVEDGATPEQVDRVLTDFGMAMGIFAVDDLGGLDVAWRIRRELNQFSEPGARRPLVADALVEMNRLGQKTGKGWYKYEGGRTPIPDPETAAVIERVTADAGIRRRPVDDEEIRERTIYALINEGARLLEEGVALRAADIDVIYLTGYGFPGFRGGPMFHADTAGLDKVLNRVSEFHRQLGDRWKPAPLLERLVREGRTFRDYDASAGRAPSAPAGGDVGRVPLDPAGHSK
jgi:3-hydroxyacyl-CoA dehydrogenase